MVRAPRVYQEQVEEGTTNSRGCGHPVRGSIEKQTSAPLLRYPLNAYFSGVYPPSNEALTEALSGVRSEHDSSGLR